MAASDAKLWIDSLTKQNVDAEIVERVAQLHQEIAPYFAVATPATVKLLFIGDCLLEDVELLIGADLLRHGLLAVVDPVVTKNLRHRFEKFSRAPAQNTMASCTAH